MKPDVNPVADEENRDNVLVISEISKGKYGYISYVVEVILSIAVLVLLIMLVIAMNIPLLIKVPSGVGVILLMLNAFLSRSAILDKENKTVTIKRNLFGFLTIKQRVEPLSVFHGVRIRLIPRIYRVQLLVELVGLYGSTLTLRDFQVLEDARELRDSISEWTNMKVMFDPSCPVNN